MRERVKAKLAKLPDNNEAPKKKIYYVVDLNEIISEELHDLFFNDPIGLKMERIIDLIEMDKPDVTKYHNISNDVSVIILVSDDIFYSEFKLFRLRLILNELPIKYNRIFNEVAFNTFKNQVFCDAYKYRLENDIAKLNKIGE